MNYKYCEDGCVIFMHAYCLCTYIHSIIKHLSIYIFDHNSFSPWLFVSGELINITRINIWTTPLNLKTQNVDIAFRHWHSNMNWLIVLIMNNVTYNTKQQQNKINDGSLIQKLILFTPLILSTFWSSENYGASVYSLLS